jgi:hypothetical protein
MTSRPTVPTGDAARAVGVSRATLSRWKREGKVTPASTTAGKHLRWDIEDLRAQLRRLSDPPPPRRRPNPAADSMRLAMRKR